MWSWWIGHRSEALTPVVTVLTTLTAPTMIAVYAILAALVVASLVMILTLWLARGRMTTVPARWLIGGAWVLASAVSLTRLYLDVHWLTDILADLFLGAAVAVVMWDLSRRTSGNRPTSPRLGKAPTGTTRINPYVSFTGNARGCSARSSAGRPLPPRVRVRPVR